MLFVITKLLNAMDSFQSRQEGEYLVEYGIVFTLASIILISTVNALAESIDTLLAMIATDF